MLLVSYMALLAAALHVDIKTLWSIMEEPPRTSMLTTTVGYGSGSEMAALVHDAQGRIYVSLPKWQNLRRYHP